MRGLAYLAVRHALHHRWRTLVLVLCVAATAFLPTASTALMARYDRDLRARADATPLVLGSRGNRFDLTLSALYFRASLLEPVPWRALRELQETGRATCVPLNLRHTARGFPVVATTPEYAELRSLALADGTDPLRIGDATLGADVAAELGLGPGDALFSDPTELYDISRPPALKMRVVGVYAPSGTADDTAVFVDVKTAWVLEGLAHGHDEPEEIDESLVISRTAESVAVSGALIEYHEVTDANVDSFHYHGDPDALPLSAVIAVPHSDKDGTLLKSAANTSDVTQVVAPRAVVDDLLGVVFRIKAFFDLVGVVLATTTAVLLALVLLLSSRLRAREMHTLDRIGAPRSAGLVLHGLEVGFVLVVAAVLAAAGTAATLAWLPDLVRTL